MTPPTSGLVEAPLVGAPSVPTRKCRTCGEEKPLTNEHYAKRSHRPSHLLDCRPCDYRKRRASKRRQREERRLSRPPGPDGGVLRRTELAHLPRATDAEMEWKELAACRGRTDWFELDPAEAKSVCAGCPVPTSCRRLIDEIESAYIYRQSASSGHTQVGVWSGEAPAERRARRRRQGRAALRARGEAWRKSAS